MPIKQAPQLACTHIKHSMVCLCVCVFACECVSVLCERDRERQRETEKEREREVGRGGQLSSGGTRPNQLPTAEPAVCFQSKQLCKLFLSTDFLPRPILSIALSHPVLIPILSSLFFSSSLPNPVSYISSLLVNIANTGMLKLQYLND